MLFQLRDFGKRHATAFMWASVYALSITHISEQQDDWYRPTHIPCVDIHDPLAPVCFDTLHHTRHTLPDPFHDCQ